MLRRQGDLAGARTAWERAAELLPESFAVWDSLAGLCDQLGDRAGAVRCLEQAQLILERAVQTDPSVAPALAMLRERIAKLRER
jgi:Flp pilus assembly protein TadD